MNHVKQPSPLLFDTPAAKWLYPLSHLAIWLAWGWLYAPVFRYFSIIFSQEDFRTNQLLLLGVMGLMVKQLWQVDLRPVLFSPPQLARPGLALAAGASLAYLAVERWLDINTLSAALFGLATYGLLSLWLAPAHWQRSLPVMLLLVGTLPFGEHLQTFVGYPMRILTAELVQKGLARLGLASVGTDTILVFENGVSHIDIPCSGVKSLWTGLLFLLAATWLEQRPLNKWWGMLALLLFGLLSLTNLARVAILTYLGPVLGWNLLAEMVHVPLGVLGFVLACGVVLWGLRQLPPWSAPAVPPSQTSPGWLTPAVLGSILLLGWLYTARPVMGLHTSPPAWQFPAELKTAPLPLKPDELAWLTRDGADWADRRTFEWQGIKGTMILISSRTWRAHHRPERCFEVYGLQLHSSTTHLVNPHFPARWVILQDPPHPAALTATYWFQSAGQTSDDYATRLWADVTLRPETWILVSLLFEEPQDPQNPQVQTLYEQLHQLVETQLKVKS